MEEFFQKVTSQQDPFKRLGSLIPGFQGYIERQNRREADKLLRDTVARRFDEQWKRASQLQVDMVSQGMIAYVDDMERAALQLRTFIDKISTAPRGYSGLFDAVKIGPMAWADRTFKGFGPRGGFGILLDDFAAALCTLLVIALWKY